MAAKTLMSSSHKFETSLGTRETSGQGVIQGHSSLRDFATLCRAWPTRSDGRFNARGRMALEHGPTPCYECQGPSRSRWCQFVLRGRTDETMAMTVIGSEAQEGGELDLGVGDLSSTPGTISKGIYCTIKYLCPNVLAGARVMSGVDTSRYFTSGPL